MTYSAINQNNLESLRKKAGVHTIHKPFLLNKPEPVIGPSGWILHCSLHEVDSDTWLTFVLLSFHFPPSLVESLVTAKLAHEAVG